ncbi:biopolymer transporter ExbD [Bizionia gelidisalsuginis]|uniref:Biopolymer transporter ExbD n=2 Tax=Bizionia TaxID=283785 RepID=A0A8H2LDE4_9FLAO|nr:MULTISPECIES: biopolymer transporter ExbD [Bizionia]TYB76113.1 biopolymer transporter ExbD [Bizionia saleffrena]TYC11405.1 biopolymer transporter ExbD [Bizionia gelidisalsuginis]
MAKRSAPEVNAGSMADIAFLLLIFFLVTTDIATDSGLNRKLPPIVDITDPPKIKERNIFQINVNRTNQIFLKSDGEERLINLGDLRAAAVKFLDNGGGTGDDACKRCQGGQNPKSSDNFDKAIISLSNDRLTKYKTYIAVQNEIIAAYNTLRDREFKREFPALQMSYVEANDRYLDPQTPQAEQDRLKDQLETIKILIPQKFSEAETKSN